MTPTLIVAGLLGGRVCGYTHGKPRATGCPFARGNRNSHIPIRITSNPITRLEGSGNRLSTLVTRATLRTTHPPTRSESSAPDIDATAASRCRRPLNESVEESTGPIWRRGGIEPSLGFWETTEDIRTQQVMAYYFAIVSPYFPSIPRRWQ